MGKTGCYLVRESIHEPSVYILCYLSHTSHVHHFKIHSNCGDYYIGGRQFLSLGDLIGFYANCSCILENESLEMPVVPARVGECTHLDYLKVHRALTSYDVMHMYNAYSTVVVL